MESHMESHDTEEENALSSPQGTFRGEIKWGR